ncbi:flagellar biosynthetic protein FliO [Ligilactobacillus agilis]|uniref:Flagellar biosynthesis protein FliZ n=1 Tax=Ligilactobacillus agilis TaxID=1601 RepID=A0A2I2ABJ3_9LACO|nr:flagellar biosynthetic protein FliO [Ligilactobacillus agilis]MBM6763049.1 flagellar biosynthetic protein FliO [Ligilactobacillus agilis]MBM6772125.1 flagellar biosynthetic protein FliO [Ligilactobacillus agilis]NJE32594.1 flagellar biosynthesis protein FliZ [Ligilactobacillus agilis]PLA76733.1 flagellar biosynthesis protein FliZ [Ligilactobacillus agilis]PLA82952.1 flagellar biosynthesis protein FliZ [Ligilactobacillus agilis]
MEMALAVVRLIIGLAVVIFLINVLMRYLNKYTTQNNDSLRLVLRVALSKNLSLGIVEILGSYYVVSMSEQKLEIIRQLEATEIEQLEANLAQKQAANEQQVEKFKEIFTKAKLTVRKDHKDDED